MKIKKGCQVSTGDPWYDLSEGGYLKPAEMLESATDARKVEEAVKTIREFLASCEDQIQGFYLPL